MMAPNKADPMRQRQDFDLRHSEQVTDTASIIRPTASRIAIGALAVALHAVAGLTGSAVAQDASPATEGVESGVPETPAAARASEPAPYDDRLARLSEIVGSVHYLRTLCGDGAEDEGWRQTMQEFIAAEAPEAERGAKFTAAFNRGYRSFASVYTTCTPAAALAEERYRSEGATLAAEIIARFGN
jgi:uncharacterized protein (TIGR02301 family)